MSRVPSAFATLRSTENEGQGTGTGNPSFLSCFSVHMDRTTCLTLRPNDSILGKAKAGGRED
jgi:hypothetical protein